jgi:hypothetical protein
LIAFQLLVYFGENVLITLVIESLLAVLFKYRVFKLRGTLVELKKGLIQKFLFLKVDRKEEFLSNLTKVDLLKVVFSRFGDFFRL